MKNMIYNIDKEQMEDIMKRYEADNRIYCAVIDGAKIQTWESFMETMIEKFELPMKGETNSNMYLDWMKDLEWLEKDGYILIIREYSKFMQADKELKHRIMKYFANSILPFWDSEVEEVVVVGEVKQFDVYLVD